VRTVHSAARTEAAAAKAATAAAQVSRTLEESRKMQALYQTLRGLFPNSL
jgi:hypothetical protein